jgi:hypothetical protein
MPVDGNGTSARARQGGAPDGVFREAGVGAAADRFVDDFLDELLPPSLDWRHLVQRYPHAAVAVAAAAGFWVGRWKGGLVLAAVTSLVAAQFGDAIVDLGEGEHVSPGPGH